MEKVREVSESRNPTQRDADRRLFLSRLEDDLDRDDFIRRGWASMLNARAIFQFWEDLVPGIFDEVDAPEPVSQDVPA